MAGRPKGKPNRTTAELRETIDRLGGCPARFLANVVAGRHVWMFSEDKNRKVRVMPSLEQRLDAAKALLPRVLPAMQAVEVDAKVDNLHGFVVTPEDLVAMSPVEREQRLLAVQGKLAELRALSGWPAAPAGDDAAPAAHSGNGAAAPDGHHRPNGGLSALGEALRAGETPAERDAEIAIVKASMYPEGSEGRTVAQLEAQAAAAAAQAGDADPDDPASVEAARYRFETVAARKPERPQFWADRMRSRRDADGN